MKCSVYWLLAFVATTVLTSAIHFAECKPTTGDTTSSGETSTTGLLVEGTTGKSTGFWGTIGKQESSSQSSSRTLNEPGEDDSVDVGMAKENEKEAGKKLPDFRWTFDPNTMTEDIQITINFEKKGEIIKVVKLIRNPDGSVREDVERTLYPKGKQKGDNKFIVSDATNQEDDDEGMFANKEVMPSAESNTKIDPGSEGIFGNTFASTEELIPIKPMDIDDTTTYPLIPRLDISSTERILEETSTEIETEETDSSVEETKSTAEEKAEESCSNNVPTTSTESDDDDEKSTKTLPTTEMPGKKTSTESPLEKPASTGEIVKTKESLASTEKEDDSSSKEGNQSPPIQSEIITNHLHHVHHKGDEHETSDAKWDDIERDSNKDAGKRKKKGKKGNTKTASPATTDSDDDSDDDDDDNDDE